MNQIGFHAHHLPKTPTERLEEAKARRDAALDEIAAISHGIHPESDPETVEQKHEQDKK